MKAIVNPLFPATAKENLPQLNRRREEVGEAIEAVILRFQKSERMLHWAIAIPFMVCWMTALILVLVYNPAPLRPLRDFFSWIHRISGVCLLIFPLIALLWQRHEIEVHFHNIRHGWGWSSQDIKWLALMLLAAINPRISLPEQGKFNAAEKLNFMMVMVACPLLIVTGVMIWLPGVAFLSWIVHFSMAALATPFMLGHIFMATINPGTRTGIHGMISGFVDREWAKHHYRRWYRENFENNRSTDKAAAEGVPPERRLAWIRCPACTEWMTASWVWMYQKFFEFETLECPKCSEMMEPLTVIRDPQVLQWMMERLDREKDETSAFVSPSGSEQDTKTASPEAG